MSKKNLLATDVQKVRQAYSKSEKDVSKDVGIIREWVKTQPHLPEIPNDHMIETFLVMNKFSIERTKPKLDMYYTVRSMMPEIFENSHPKHPRMQRVYKQVQACPLPTLTKELYRVYVMKVIGDPDDYDVYETFAHMLNTYEVRIQEDRALGDVFLIDYEHLQMGHVMKMTPVQIKKAAIILEKVLSNRVKGIHLLNSPTYVDILMNISKLVLKPKLLNRIHLHNKLEDLYEFIPKEVLPVDYGGEEMSLEELIELWKGKLDEYSDRFDKLASMNVKEELRPEPLQNDDVLGFHGNFKKVGRRLGSATSVALLKYLHDNFGYKKKTWSVFGE